MKRKSIIYRRLWYARRRNPAGIHVILRLLAVMLVLIFSYYLFACIILPGLRQTAETEIRKAYISALRESSGRIFSRGPEYREIIVYTSTPDGDISAISLDSSILEGMTGELLKLTDLKLGLPDSWRILVPIIGSDGIIFGPKGILDFEMKVFQDVRTVVNYQSEFIPINEGQTKLTVTMTAEAEIHYMGRLLEGYTMVTEEIPVGEYIIFGKLPVKK